MKRKLKKNRFLIYILIGMFLLIMPFILKFPQNAVADQNLEIVLIELEKGTKIEKTFKAEFEDMDYAAIQFATYSKQIEGKIGVTIKNKENNKIIYNKKIDAVNLIDNMQHIFKFDKQKDSKNKEYVISIEILELREEDKISIYGHSTDKEKVTINGEDSKLDYAVIYGYHDTCLQLLMYFLIYLVVIGFIEVLKGDE